ncbi:hypothetical protein EW026_g2889 [Hermanssonia centrifuga]|uniref:Uncharacterized protein n=1 Tax=Hermanssonia centrifuga TaxID=98765 RepID=A0A4S4KMF5_9APHY|nr:hypothetical protein EW026_g2889 [Hermanssonia centrifuga]
MSGVAWHYVLKFIITGDAAVGKSSLLVRLTDQRFLANPDPTLGVEFGSKLITIPEENKVVKLQLGNKVDLCADADEGSDASRDQPSVTLKKAREVSTDEAELWAKEEGLLFVEASAKSGVNVEAAFERATRDILEKIRKGVFDDERDTHGDGSAVSIML